MGGDLMIELDEGAIHQRKVLHIVLVGLDLQIEPCQLAAQMVDAIDLLAEQRQGREPVLIDDGKARRLAVLGLDVLAPSSIVVAILIEVRIQWAGVFPLRL